MEFRETLLAAQRNQQQKSSESSYYKARFDPPKKEQKSKDKLSANIQKFLAKKDEEEKMKKLEAQRKRDELLAMRDPKALRKIQKTLKVIKSANKSVIADAIDRDNTAITLTGPEQPDQDDYGYESQEAAALYQKMMQKYSKIPDEPKFPTGNQTIKRDLNGTRERVKHALQHEDDPVPHKRRRKTGEPVSERDQSPPSKYEPEKEKKREDAKPDKPKIRKPLPPPMDFNQLLKLAEQKKGDPLEVVQKKSAVETEKERLMTKKQKREYEEEMARRQRRQERLDAEKNGKKKVQKEEKVVEKEKKVEPSGSGRIPKLSDKFNSNRNDNPKPLDRDKKLDRDKSDRDKLEKLHREKERARMDREKTERIDREKADRLDRERLEREKERIDRERLELLKAERDRIERDIDRLNRDRDRLDKTKTKIESRSDKKPLDKLDRTKLNGETKNIDLKTQNTYRIDRNSNDKKFTIPKDGRLVNGHSSQKPVPKGKEQIVQRNGMKDKVNVGKPVSNDRSPKIDPRVENGKRPPERPNVPKVSDDKRLPPKTQSAAPGKTQAGPSKPKLSNTFDFDKHVNSLKNGQDPNRNGMKRPGDLKKRPNPDDMRRKQKRRALDSESEYDSEMDDFIDDGDEELDVSTHIKEIFGYDKSKYRDMDDDDDPMMESSFARQQREEYISKKIGIMEDLEDMRMEAMEKKKTKKSRRISDD